jgi:alanyl-tRNA synthetase
MTSAEIRQKFLDYFKSKGHAVVKSSSLIPDDPSVLLTTAGMQQFKKYYTGELDAMRDFGAKSTASVQKSFRTSDIDEVGDERHLTFFEMLGNFSFGGYFKKEAIEYAHEFITKEMGLEISYVTVFQGKPEIGVPKDEESIAIWNSLGVTDVREEGMADVFWGPTGSEGPCGPTTEIYCRNGAGQDIEVWNIVFNQFFFPGSREELESGSSGKNLEPLKTPGVDTGMGLERLVMSVQKTNTIFETDLFQPLIQVLPTNMQDRSKRIVSDHIRASVFLIADGVRPSNKGAGYILRRLLRRSIVHAHLASSGSFSGMDILSMGHELDILNLIEAVIGSYGNAYPEIISEKENITSVFKEENNKFSKTMRNGLKELNRLPAIDATSAFKIFESHGLPYEIIKELGGEKTAKLERKDFEEEFKKHQEISKAGSEAKFGGHGLYLKTGEVTIRDASEVEKVTRLHTATHLMHAALRAVLGPEVRQDGSDITIERTRFDFRFPRKVAPEELKQVEDWVNGAIQKDLTVEWKEMDYEEAIKDGALGFFKAKYPPRVKVYTMYDKNTGEVYSKEFCGGPHVEHTGTVGAFKITKEESSSAGIRRIRGIIEP